MKKCIDENMGRMMGRYEFDLLTPEERNEFEAHLVECDYCFRELYEFSPAVKTIKENAKQFRKAVSPSRSIVANIKDKAAHFLPDPVVPFIPAISAAVVAIIIIATVWQFIKQSAPSDLESVHKTAPTKIVLHPPKEMEAKGEMEEFIPADFVSIRDLATKVKQDMHVTFNTNGDSLIFTLPKISGIKKIQIFLFYGNNSLRITPAKGIQDTLFIYPVKGIRLDKINKWGASVDLKDGSHFKTEKELTIKK